VTIEDLKNGTKQLNQQELAEFRRWFIEYDWEAWDSEIEEDAAAGKLNYLAEKAISDYKEGRCTEL